jgi:hypothetical protein
MSDDTYCRPSGVLQNNYDTDDPKFLNSKEIGMG